MPKANTHPISYRQKQNEGNELHPLRKLYLQNRLKDIEYQERQQNRQDNFVTRLYGKKDFSDEKNEIMAELMHGEQSNNTGARPNSKINPNAPEPIKNAINRFAQEEPAEYNKYIKQMQDGQKTWEQINKDINDGKITPQELSSQQWQNILDTNSQDLQKAKSKEGSYCNYYARERLLQRGIYMPPGQNANQIKDHMDNHSQDWEKIPRKIDVQGHLTNHLDHQAAHDAAARGDTVIVVYKNSNSKDHGHIALVDGQKEMQISGKWGVQLPCIDGYNSSAKEIKGESLSEQFSPIREPDMDYYRYIGKKREENDTVENEDMLDEE